MTAFAKFKMQGLLVLALVGLVTGVGWAGAVTLVKIDDLTEGPPSIAIFGGGILPTILSDSAGEFLHFTLPAGAFNVLNIVENGNFQFAGNLDFGEITIYQFQVRSDVADVPAPATLLLLGSGLAAVCSATWRRCRRAE